jgi:hypothetical protein
MLSSAADDDPLGDLQPMAKRARGTPSRPGQRARLQRGPTATRPPVASPETAPRPATLTDEEEARAAELEERILAAERAAEAATTRRGRGRPSPAADDVSVRSGSIAVRANQEYAYVARDIRRIALIGGSILATLVGLWIVLQVTGNSLA